MSRVHTCPPADLLLGHTRQGDLHVCLFCESSFEDGQVYRDPDNDVFRVALKAASHHVDTAHGGPLAALLALGKSGHGLSDVQQQVLVHLGQGLDDKQIATELGGRSLSTVRNHRFQLRKKHREARVFSAMMALLESGESTPAAPPSERFVEFHVELPTSDDRTAITTDEEKRLLDKYFVDPEHTVLDRIPKKEKHKLVVLKRVVERLDRGVRYHEREVNQRLKSVHADTAALRRYLVDYRFVQRVPDGSAYWRTDGDV